MKIAIIGSGFFGSSLALILSKSHKIDLYENKNEIMCGASKANQFRFHSGYHYPRSQKTVKEINKYKKIFTNYFGLKIFNQTQNYYSIAKKNSKVSVNQYIKFLKKNDLYFKKYRNSKFFSNKISSSFRVKEKILNYFNIKEIILKKDLEDIENFHKKKKFNLVIISNQPDFSRKLIDSSFIQENIKKILSELSISIALICPHLSSDNCQCRKPNIGLIEFYRKQNPNCCKEEIFIGDQISDEKCAKSLKIPFIKIHDSYSVYNNISKILNNYKNIKLEY